MFELSDEMIRQVIFGMENQNHRYLLDVTTGRVVREDHLEEQIEPDLLDPEARYYVLPEWKSADGFNLMQRFLGELPNPQLRGELNEILLSGKKIFRRFKDKLAEHPDAQKRYYVFKYLEMRSIVAEWYNTLREIKGLDTLEIGFEDEIGDLILTDIVIKEPDPLSAAVFKDLDRRAFHEALGDLPSDVVHYLYRRRIDRLPGLDDARSIVFAAYNPIGDLCGFLWAVDEEDIDAGRRFVTIEQLYVLPDYRRLGIADALLDHFERGTPDHGAGYRLVRVYGEGDFRGEALVHRGFRTVSTEYLRG